MPLPTYDPQLGVTSFAGNILDGFVPDSFVEIARNQPAFKYHASATGKGARSRNRDASCKITLRLLATSPSNDVLNARHLLDLATGAGIGEFVYKDSNGTTHFVGEAWISECAQIKRGAEVDANEWVLECAEPAVFNVGGIPAA